MNPEEKDKIESNSEEEKKVDSEVKGGYTPMTDKQIRKVRIILYIVFGLIAGVIVVVRAIKGS